MAAIGWPGLRVSSQLLRAVRRCATITKDAPQTYMACMLRSDPRERVAVSMSRPAPSAPTDSYRTLRSRSAHGRPSPPNV
jgi:hypothetical protein